MFIVARCEVARTPSGVPCAGYPPPHFTPDGVSILRRADGYEHSTTNVVVERRPPRHHSSLRSLS
jgi:hypothetical protein